MAEKVEGIEAIPRIGLNRLERLTRGLPEEQLLEAMPGVQLVQWILT